MRVQPNVSLFILEPWSLHFLSCLSLGATLVNHRRSSTFRSRWSNHALGACAWPQGRERLKYETSVFSSVHLSYVDLYFRLTSIGDLNRLKHVDPYLGSDRRDDLRDPDSERSNQRVAACAAHAPSLCFSWAKPSVNTSIFLISRFDNALLLLFLPHPNSCVPDFSFLQLDNRMGYVRSRNAWRTPCRSPFIGYCCDSLLSSPTPHFMSP